MHHGQLPQELPPPPTSQLRAAHPPAVAAPQDTEVNVDDSPPEVNQPATNVDPAPHPEPAPPTAAKASTAHTALLERIASFGTSGYGCHHGAMRLLVVCAVRKTGFLSRTMPPSELDPFLEAVDANISAAFSLLGLDYACDQSTPRMEAAIVQMSMPADFGGLNMAFLQFEAPAAVYSAQFVVLPKLVREYGPALGPLYEPVRAEVSSVATSALPWARETHRVYETCTPGIAATEAERNKQAADRASSAPVQCVNRLYPFVVEDRGRLGKSALTVV
eukprot:jgi/Tetstr1/422112/TSEL_012969.t1